MVARDGFESVNLRPSGLFTNSWTRWVTKFLNSAFGSVVCILLGIYLLKEIRSGCESGTSTCESMRFASVL